MNFIAKHLSLIGILLLTVFVGAAAGLYFDVPGRLQRSRSAASAAQTFTCPMHTDVVQDHPGDCPKCGMALVLAGQSKSAHDQCEHTGQNQSGCCADKNAGQASSPTVDRASVPGDSRGTMPPEPADKMPAPHRLPPGHPPVPGWTIEELPKNEPASTNTAPHSSH